MFLSSKIIGNFSMLNLIVYILYLVLEKTIPLFPLKFSRYLAVFWSKIFYYFIPIRKKTAINNLKIAFPEKSIDEIHQIVKGVYRNVLIVIFEFFYLNKLSDDDYKKLIKFPDIAIIHKLLEINRGLIFVSAHFGNWELAAIGGSRILEIPFTVIVKEQSNQKLDRKINEVRSSRGNIIIEMKQSIREILRLMKAGGIAAMLADQSAPKENSVKVNLFGKTVPAFEGAARFALKTGAKVIYIVPVRNKDFSYTAIIKEIDTNKYKEYSEENIQALTQEHMNMLMECIKKYPDHWLWFHRRFKHAE